MSAPVTCAFSCPTNSTANSAGICVCNAGFTPSTSTSGTTSVLACTCEANLGYKLVNNVCTCAETGYSTLTVANKNSVCCPSSSKLTN